MSKKIIRVSVTTFRALAHAHGFVCDDEIESTTEYTAVPVVIMLDPIIHSDQQPYCSDPTCPCQMDRVYKPDGSNYHDHLCRCPGCDPQPPNCF